jgi:diguanylate cyclase (GGDEF)-like protein/hemerythrin-like metal-binding protein
MSFSFFSLINTYRHLWYVISVGFIVILIGMGLLGYQIITEVQLLESKTQKLYTHPFRVNAAARNANLEIAQLRIHSLEAVANLTSVIPDELAAQSRKHSDRLIFDLDVIKENFLGDLSKVEEAKSLATEWTIERNKLYDLIEKNRESEARNFLQNEATPIYLALNERLVYIQEFSTNKAATFAAEAELDSRRILNEFTGLLTSLILFTLVSGGVTLKVVLNQVQRRDNQSALDQEHIAHMANYDELTDLPNRALFYDRLKQAMTLAKRNRSNLSLMFMDLDGFKNVNDTLGHLAGDELLKKVAERLSRCVRESDTVGRIGGDEFAIIFNDAETLEQVSTLAAKLIETIHYPFDLQGQEASIGISIGISCYSDVSATPDDLLNNADIAMYESKKNGKNRYTFYSQADDGSKEEWIKFDQFQHIGIYDLDEQHHGLTRTLNRLNGAILNNKPKKEILDLYDELIGATASHFETEERYMIHYHYPERDAHIKEHSQLVNDAKKFREQLCNAGDTLNLQSIRDWLLNHIQNSDKPLADFLLRHGVS